MTTTPPDRRLFDPLPIAVSRPLVLLRLGYRSAAQVPAKTARLIDEVSLLAAGLARPRACCAVVPIGRPADGSLVLGEMLRTGSRSLASRLEGCSIAVLFAATIGPGLEDKVRELNEAGDMTRALLADAYGSSAAIALGMALEERVGGEFRGLGLETTKRYAPGYGDFEMEAQRPLLDLVDAGRIGIALTADHLMLPGKSISGVIGGRG